MKNVQTDVITNHVTIIEKAILIAALFSRHFDPHSMKKNQKKQKPINSKILDKHSKQEKCLETKALFTRK